MPFFSARTVLRLMKEGRIVIEPWDPCLLHESGEVSLTLSESYRTVAGGKREPGIIDLSEEDDAQFTDHTICARDRLVIHRGAFVLLKTRERIKLTPDICCLLTTRPDLAQVGLDLTQTSMFVRGGTDCRIVLELSHHGPVAVRLSAGVRIVKAVFAEVM